MNKRYLTVEQRTDERSAYQELVDEFIRIHGVTKCPTAPRDPEYCAPYRSDNLARREVSMKPRFKVVK